MNMNIRVTLGTMGIMASAATADVANNQTEWLGGYLWSRMSDLEPPPSLVKCLGATVAGSIFALLGMMMENYRSRRDGRTKEGISREELGNLIPKRSRGTSGETSPDGSTLRQRGIGRTMSAPATASSNGSKDGSGNTRSPARSATHRLAPEATTLGGRELSEVERAERQVKSCLNKITREKFNTLYDQIRECIATSCTLRRTVLRSWKL